MKIYATNIMWDVDDNMDGILPTEVEIPFDLIDNYGVESIADWLSEKYEMCHQGFNLVDKDNTFLYLVDFKYIGDTSSFSANIPDQIGFQCLLESEVELKDIPIYKIKEDYRIQEYMDQNDCETISLTEITSLEEYFDLMSELEYIYFQKSDIEFEQEEKDEI